MKVVGLVSGGKDSTYNMLQCIAAGHEIVALANIEPQGKDELDSYMYQSVGHQVVSLMAGAVAIPLFRQKTKGVAHCKNLTYSYNAHDEVEDLFKLLSKVKDELNVEGVSVGAVLSDYQRLRVEHVCSRLNLKSLAFLWRRDQVELLDEMINAEIHAVLIKVASIGLIPDRHLGKSIQEMSPTLKDLNRKFGVSVCGEGGEYETLTLDCPLFHRMISLVDTEVVIHSNDAFAPVAYLNVKNAALETKSWGNIDTLHTLRRRIDHILSIVKSPLDYIQDCLEPFDIPEPEPKSSRDRSFSVSSTVSGVTAPELSRTRNSISPVDQHSMTSVKSVNRSSASRVTFTSNTSFPDTIDTSCFHVNHTTGWCWISNVSAATPQQACAIIKKNLDRLQYETENIVSVSVYLKDMSEFAHLNKAYSQAIASTTSPPVRACVSVPLPADVSIVMDVTAHRMISKLQKVFHRTVSKDTIHVQSISHWAPANIGPYSQCVKIGEIIYVAGQIPLVPGSMELLLNHPVPQQCRLSLRHVKRILQACNAELSLKNVTLGICYLTKEADIHKTRATWNYVSQNDKAAVGYIVVSGLPKGALLEWQVMACTLPKLQREFVEHSLKDDYKSSSTRCFYAEQCIATVVTNISYTGKQDKNSKIIETEDLVNMIKHTLQVLRGTFPPSTLCNLRIFYKVNSYVVGSMLQESVRLSNDVKVVATVVPVVACGDGRHVFMTVAGVCH